MGRQIANYSRIVTAILALLMVVSCGANENRPPPSEAQVAEMIEPTQERFFFIGQDLDALRGYFGSQCCPMADGATAYLSLYRLKSEPDFGGLGYRPDGTRLSPEASWGAGKVGAAQTAQDFGIQHVAIGLYIAEEEQNGLVRIADGEFDAEIRHLAKFIHSVEGLVFLRIGYEFDGTWNPGYDNTSRYIAAYRHIVDGLRNEGVDNVRFVWQASASPIDDVIERRAEDITGWYPGDDYVDWMGLSWFMSGEARPAVDSNYKPATPRALTDEVLTFARARGKPVMIAEAAPQGFDLNEGFRANISPIWDGEPGQSVKPLTNDEIWEAWYEPLFNLLDENSDVIRAIAYINVDWDAQPMWGTPYASGFWGDSRLETNTEIAKRFEIALKRWKKQK